jgi:hypothetical protein
VVADLVEQQVELVRHGPAHVMVVMVILEQMLKVVETAVAEEIVMVQEALQLMGDLMVELLQILVQVVPVVQVEVVPEVPESVRQEHLHLLAVPE